MSMRQTRAGASSRQASQASGTRLSQREIDNSCHRLSRVPQKFGPPKQESNESYAVSFFNNNPEIPLDKRPPSEKLEEIDSKLTGDLEDTERFNLLVQKKSLSFLAYGENSPESFHALCQLGEFYNQQNRPESALRHLARAQQISKTVEITDEEGLAMAVEVADAYLTSRANTRQESSKNLNAAESALRPYDDVKTDDKMVQYKRDLLTARIRGRRGKFSEALEKYEDAVKSLDRANDGETNSATAALYAEMGECAEAGRDRKQAKKMYKKAHQTFLDLDMAESARMIEPKLQELEESASETDEDQETGEASDEQV